MAYEMKDMSGSVFKNRKRDRDTSPHLTGSCKIEGKEYWVNVWTKIDKNGDEWFSFGFKEKLPKQEQAREPVIRDDFGDSIPF